MPREIVRPQHRPVANEREVDPRRVEVWGSRSRAVAGRPTCEARAGRGSGC